MNSHTFQTLANWVKTPWGILVSVVSVITSICGIVAYIDQQTEPLYGTIRKDEYEYSPPVIRIFRKYDSLCSANRWQKDRDAFIARGAYSCITIRLTNEGNREAKELTLLYNSRIPVPYRLTRQYAETTGSIEGKLEIGRLLPSEFLEIRLWVPYLGEPYGDGEDPQILYPEGKVELQAYLSLPDWAKWPGVMFHYIAGWIYLLAGITLGVGIYIFAYKRGRKQHRRTVIPKHWRISPKSKCDNCQRQETHKDV